MYSRLKKPGQPSCLNAVFQKLAESITGHAFHLLPNSARIYYHWPTGCLSWNPVCLLTSSWEACAGSGHWGWASPGSGKGSWAPSPDPGLLRRLQVLLVQRKALRCVHRDTGSVLIARATEVLVVFESTKQGRESWLGFPCASQSARGLCTCLWASWYAGRSLVWLCIKSGTSVRAKVPHGHKQLLP